MTFCFHSETVGGSPLPAGKGGTWHSGPSQGSPSFFQPTALHSPTSVPMPRPRPVLEAHEAWGRLPGTYADHGGAGERRLAWMLTPWKDETPRTRPRLISTPHWSLGPLTQKSGRIPTLRPILGDVCPEAHRETKAQSEHRSWCACAEATTSCRSDAPAHEKGRSLKSPASSSPSLPESVPLWLLLEPV